MKPLLKAVLTLIVFCSCTEEKTIYDFNIKNINQATSLESSLGATKYTTPFPGPSKSFYPYSDSLTPPDKGLFFRRKNDDFIPLITKYFYDSKTNEVKMIVYEWSKAIPGTSEEEYKELTKNEMKKRATYDQLYQKTYNELHEKYGQHTVGNGRLVKSGLEVFPTWKRQLGWRSDTLNIDLVMNWIPTDQLNIYNIILKAYP